MISVQEFAIRVSVEHQVLENWISAGWLVPQNDPELTFSDADLARAQLIRELKEDFGVNDEGISVALHLLDQVHGLRRTMRELLDELHRRSSD
jgi:chaperone modulatory protein CbpM